MKYFTQSVWYPNMGGEILPMNILHEYVSHTFLAGFLNYSKPIKAFLMHRYEDDPEVNKLMAKEFNDQKHIFHCNFSEFFKDDIVMLSVHEETGDFWYFWMDRDVSDCMIGRFRADDPFDEVVAEFVKDTKFIQQNLGYVEHDEPCIEIDVSKIKGWLGCL